MSDVMSSFSGGLLTVDKPPHSQRDASADGHQGQTYNAAHEWIFLKIRLDLKLVRSTCRGSSALSSQISRLSREIRKLRSKDCDLSSSTSISAYRSRRESSVVPLFNQPDLM